MNVVKNRIKKSGLQFMLSLFTTFYILVHGKGIDFIERVVMQPTFYLAILYNLPVTFGFVWLIGWANEKLDNKISWRDNWRKRFQQQLLLGIAPFVILDLIFVSIYQLLIGKHFDILEFIWVDFPMIIILIATLNMCYAIMSLIKDNRVPENPIEVAQDITATINVRYASVSLNLNVENDILYFYITNGNLRIVTANREFSGGKKTLTQMELLYESFGFCRISRSTLINLNIVRTFDGASVRNNLKIIFKDPTIIPNPDSELLLVKKEYVQKFHEALKNK